MLRARRVFTTLALSVAVAASSATTTSAFALQPADAKKADPLKEGLDLAKQGKHEAALAKFEEAYALSRTGVPVYNIARMEQALGRHAIALHHYREALRDTNLPTDARRETEKAIEGLKTKVAVIAFDVPPGAATTVDGSDVDVTGTLEVVPGRHVVKIKQGGDVKSTMIDAPIGEVTTVKLRFGADGAEAPGTGAPPPSVTPPPQEERRSTIFTTRNIVGGSLGAVGLVAGAVGVGFLLGAEGAVSDAESFNRGVPEGACSALGTCRQYDAMLDDARGDRTVGIVSLVGGAVLIAGAAAVFAFWPSTKEASSSAARVRLNRGLAVSF